MGCGIVTQRAEKLQASGAQLNAGTDLRGAGIAAKVVPLTAGQRIIKHKHSYDHLSLLASGKVMVQTDDSQRLIDATEKPQSVVISAGQYHAVHALADSLWICVHPDEGDL